MSYSAEISAQSSRNICLRVKEQSRGAPNFNVWCLSCLMFLCDCPEVLGLLGCLIWNITIRAGDYFTHSYNVFILTLLHCEGIVLFDSFCPTIW